MRYLSISAKKFWLWTSVGLIGLLIIAALLAGLQLLFGHWHSRRDELAIIKQRVDAKELQAWAKQILRQYPDRTELFAYFPGMTADPTMVILSNPPVLLWNMGILGRMGPSISVSAAGASSNRYVSLLYAESFGFGGDGHIVEVGDESFKAATNNRCVEWIPGVYYCYTHSP